MSEAGHSELRVWHLAAAAITPDEELAAELQHTAERAGTRGGYAARAALLRRAADLTPDDARRAEREVALAEARLMAGDPAGAQDTLGGALPRLTGTTARGRAQRLDGAICFAQGNAAEAARILARAARAVAGDDRMARDTMLMALQAAIWAGPAQTREIARAARAFPPVPEASASVADLLLEGYSARFTLGYQASVEPFRAAVAALLADDLEPAVGLRWFALGTAAAGSLWDDQATFELSRRWVKMARAAGAFTTLPVALAFNAVSESMAGHFREADTTWASMLEVLTMSSGPGVPGVNSRSSGLLLAYRGRLTEARETGLAQVRESAARGQDGPADIGRYIVAVAGLFGGDYPAAMSYAQTVIDDDPACTAEVALPELIEAAVRAGDYEAAATAHKTLSERALAAGHAVGARAACPLRGAAGRGCGRGGLLPGIHQPAQAVPDGRRPRAHSPALRPVAAPGQAAAERTARTAHRAGHVRRDGHRRVRRASGPRTAGHRGDRPQAHRRNRCRADCSRDPGRAAGPGRAVESRDRSPPVHQRAHRPVPPRQGLHQAGHQLALPARASPPGRPRVTSRVRHAAVSAT